MEQVQLPSLHKPYTKYTLRLLDGPAFCAPPGRAKKSLGPAGPGRVSGQIKMTKKADNQIRN